MLGKIRSILVRFLLQLASPGLIRLEEQVLEHGLLDTEILFRLRVVLRLSLLSHRRFELAFLPDSNVL